MTPSFRLRVAAERCHAEQMTRLGQHQSAGLYVSRSNWGAFPAVFARKWGANALFADEAQPNSQIPRVVCSLTLDVRSTHFANGESEQLSHRHNIEIFLK